MVGKLYNINYLEDSDFDSSGKFNYDGNWNIFIYGDFCPHCHTVLPIIQQLVNEKGSARWAAIQIDGARDSEKKLSKRLGQIISPAKFKGVPTIISIKNRRFSKEYSGDRSKNSIKAFSQS